MKTKWAVLWSSLLFEPFAALYPLLPVILLKGAGATGLQIVLLTMLKPVSSLFSLYWSERVSQNRQTLKGNLLGAGLLARLPFLGALFFDNVWLFVAASTLYMLFSRAGIPAWMEMLKQSLPAKERERVFSWGSAIGYAEGALIAIGLGAFLDQSVDGWKLCFAAASLLGLAGLFIQLRVPIRHVQEPPLPTNALQPWRDCYTLMKTHAPFRRFQWAFMAGGLGLMLIQPVIPVFFADTLTITYRDLMIAYSICKGLGFVTTASAPLWTLIHY